MDHLNVPQFLGLLVLILGSAKLLGAGAKRIGQPAVLGELLAGVILGSSVLGLVNPKNEVLHLLSELGVVILLFEIGLEIDLGKLLKVGGASIAVAIVGILAPFALGYGVCRLLGLAQLPSIVAGATLTATSVGITARVLSDLGRLQDTEGQIIVGAAVIDDVMGLVILAVVSGLAAGQGVTAGSIAKITGVAFGFLILTLVLGGRLVPPLVKWFSTLNVPGMATSVGLMLALGLAWLADRTGSAMIIGAFAAGLLLRATPQVHEIERGVGYLGHFFVPIFFVVIGAAVDVRVFNPIHPANRQTLLIGGLLILAAMLGKFVAGYAPFWFRGRKMVIGVGMIPRGEVGLIFAQMGLASGIFDGGQFSAVALMVMVTTFVAPPLLRLLLPPIPSAPAPAEGFQNLVMEP